MEPELARKNREVSLTPSTLIIHLTLNRKCMWVEHRHPIFTDIFVRDLREHRTNLSLLPLTQSPRWSSFQRGQYLDGRPTFIYLFIVNNKPKYRSHV